MKMNLLKWNTNLIPECKVDALLGDVDGPDLGVDDDFVSVRESAHVGSNLNWIQNWGLKLVVFIGLYRDGKKGIK